MPFVPKWGFPEDMAVLERSGGVDKLTLPPASAAVARRRPGHSLCQARTPLCSQAAVALETSVLRTGGRGMSLKKESCHFFPSFYPLFRDSLHRVLKTRP